VVKALVGTVKMEEDVGADMVVMKFLKVRDEGWMIFGVTHGGGEMFVGKAWLAEVQLGFGGGLICSVVLSGGENVHGIVPRGKWRVVEFYTLTE